MNLNSVNLQNAWSYSVVPNDYQSVVSKMLNSLSSIFFQIKQSGNESEPSNILLLCLVHNNNIQFLYCM